METGQDTIKCTWLNMQHSESYISKRKHLYWKAFNALELCDLIAVDCDDKNRRAPKKKH